MSKAILEYGPFRATLEADIEQPEIHVIKPFNTLMDFKTHTLEPPTGTLEFRLKERVNQDIAVYEFVREA